MSAETSAWAKEQTCGDRTVKAVLREIANWARPDGVVEFLHVKRIAGVIEVSTRTVQRAIAQLEEPTLECPGRLGLIRRVERFRDDGGQGACGFILLGYQPPIGITPRDKMSPPHDTGVTLPRDKMSGDGVTPTSPLKRDKILPPSEPKGSEAPTDDLKDQDQGEKGGQRLPSPPSPSDKPHRLPDDWALPALSDLGDKSGALAQLWPSGAYEAVAEQFRLHWLAAAGPTARKHNWDAAWAKWVITEHDKIMRAAKAGTNFAPAAPAKTALDRAAQAPVAAKATEDDRSAIMHNLLERDLGERTYAKWIKAAAITFDEEGAILIFATDFQRSYVETNLGQRIAVALARVAKPSEPQILRYSTESIVCRSQQEAQAA